MNSKDKPVRESQGSRTDTSPSDAAANPPNRPVATDAKPKERAAPASSGAPESVAVGRRRAQYMIAPRMVGGFQPLSADTISQHMMNNPNVTYVKTMHPPSRLGLLSLASPALGPLVIARMTPDHAELMQRQAGATVAIVRDPPLTYVSDPVPLPATVSNPGILVPSATGFATTIEVVGENGPLPEADVFVYGSMFPVHGVTDERGRVSIKVEGDSPDNIRFLYVKPRVDHWSLWLERPDLAPDSVNTVTVKPLGSFIRDFPGNQVLGWGQKAMGLDKVSNSFDGAGVKVVIIDSGAAQPTHRNLHALGPGVSIVGDDQNAWTADIIGHGSHCAGIIGGGPPGSAGIRGFAPAAEIRVCRIFPGGRFSDLASALDYCIENDVDVVNLSLGGPANPIVEQRILQAKDMGIACIVAAGNSAGPVQFPASTRHVLAVAAMGKWGEFPDDSIHAQQAVDGFESANGYFPATFSCFGPEVDVCAPGVAIISSLPTDGYAAWDGTSMATPHVTGMAALVLAHHPDFKAAYQKKDARRVERLYQIIKASCTSLQFGDPARTGAGLPSVPRALGIDTGADQRVGAEAPDPAIEALRRLLGLPGASAAEAPQQPKAAAASAGVSRAGVPQMMSDLRGDVDAGLAPMSVSSRGPASADPLLAQIRAAMIREGLL